FVVHKNVTCVVLGGTESVVEPEIAPCPMHQPDCAQRVIYRTHMRPMYKVGHKQVTELEWRCCPGFHGHDCMELKDPGLVPHVLQEPRPDPPPIHGQQPNFLGMTSDELVTELEEEVQRLSQAVLDLQAANNNLRLDLEEDTSKIILNFLGNLRQPQGALAGGTESILLPLDLPITSVTDEIQEQVQELSNTISTNTNTIHHLETKLQHLEGQVNRLNEVSAVSHPSPPSAPDCPCQAYIDEQFQAIRTEMLEGMDIKMADLKNACDYKMLSVKEQCEEQEASYFSLTELLESKEARLHQEIGDLQRLISAGIPNGSDVLDLQLDIQNMKNAHQSLASELNETITQQEAQEEEFEAKFNHTNSQYMAEIEKHTGSLKSEVGSLAKQVKNMENSVRGLNQMVNCQNHTDELSNRLDKLEEDCGRSQEVVIRLEGVLSGVDGRLTRIESLCGRLEPMSDSLLRIKDGLNKHVHGLWNCIRQLNSTVLAHSTDINALRTNTHTTVCVHGGMEESSVPMETSSALPPSPVLESGEAGPPGTKISSRPPQGANGSMTPVKGYAAAPGEWAVPSSSAYITLKSVIQNIHMYFTYTYCKACMKCVCACVSGGTSTSAPVSFSSGLTLLSSYSGEVGIIRFNKVLLNDGRHYDPNTGVFTAPMDGRYLLSVVITAPEGDRAQAVLSVANRSIQRLDTSGSGAVASTGCLCGGSASASLVLDLRQGQKAGVVLMSGTLAVSVSTEVLSTFSGVLLYPLQANR
uniref:Elastin microfibril interfacer 2b n=1 Tax=Electrophorus electricus TaxID=8005 RepID=A0A4W4DU65_ELEEL